MRTAVGFTVNRKGGPALRRQTWYPNTVVPPCNPWQVAGNAAQKRNDRALVTLNKAFAEHGLEVKRLLDMESNEDQCQGAWYDITLTCPV